jgi:hypothetical protein
MARGKRIETDFPVNKQDRKLSNSSRKVGRKITRLFME